MDIKLVEKIQEDWKDHTDPKGFIKAAHNPENCLLVWWYNPFTGDFRKAKEKTVQHKELDKFGLEGEDLSGWLRGRVFNFNNTNYLIVYVLGSRLISADFLNDLYDLIHKALGVYVFNVIDDEGNNLKGLFESWKKYNV